jgi:hypothetical protein
MILVSSRSDLFTFIVPHIKDLARGTESQPPLPSPLSSVLVPYSIHIKIYFVQSIYFLVFHLRYDTMFSHPFSMLPPCVFVLCNNVINIHLSSNIYLLQFISGSVSPVTHWSWTTYFSGNSPSTVSCYCQKFWFTPIKKVISIVLQNFVISVRGDIVLTISMEQSPSWDANSHSASQEIPHFYETRGFVTVFTRARHWSLSWARRIQTTPS